MRCNVRRFLELSKKKSVEMIHFCFTPLLQDVQKPLLTNFYCAVVYNILTKKAEGMHTFVSPVLRFKASFRFSLKIDSMFLRHFGALVAFLLLFFMASAFTAVRPLEQSQAGEAIVWYTWEEAVALNKTKPKKMMIDLYTDWCGWCKVMDKKTFADSEVAAYINKNFYPVKFNAEQKKDVRFNDQTFSYIETGGGRGVHTLAYALLDGKMGYPTIVYLNEKYERILISPGYKEVPDMLKELKFTAEEHYATTSWEAYKGK